EFGIRHRGSTVPERSGVALSFCRRPVKSREEQLIADWLFIQGVEYKYEAPYPIKTESKEHSQYQPDFYYPQIKLYHEHFALNAQGIPPIHFKNYAEGVDWKRTLHQQNQTELFETTSHMISTGEGLPALQHALESRGVVINPDPDRPSKGRPPLEIDVLARIIRNLMQHAKGNHLGPSELSARAQTIDPIRGPLIISLYSKVLELWQAELTETNTVDFDDMINLAIENAESGKYRSPYKLVIVDEYQDASAARARLLRAITVLPDTFLTAVGDDAQSINRFAGADMSVMKNFVKFFGSGTELKLTMTFRCPVEICNVSNYFVQQNPIQITKVVTTTSSVSGKAIQCYAAESMDDLSELVKTTLTKIEAKLKTVWDLPRKPSIMLLGRYRSDEPHNMAELRRICGPTIDLTFTTVHSSKGTEADYVLILNVIQGRKGFPSEIADDPILQCAMPEPEKYPFAEERRLFYVALTRARRGVFIYTLEGRSSAFLSELAGQGYISIVGKDGAAVSIEPCPLCRDGIRKRKTSQYGDFYSCSNYPSCKWKENIRGASETVSRRPPHRIHHQNWH
ncbi:UvrD-helicase domain-containing protein, partial [Pseudomonas marincola]|uniref:UvrD-helicase domain-containing protein n=2 Tax=Pseudomonas TaxID=286 RepID=UPI00300181F4